MPGSQSFKIPYVVFEVKVWWDEVKVDFIGQREESCAKRREVKCGARRPDVVSTRVNLEHHQVSNLCLDQPQFLRPPIPRYFRWRSSSRQNRLLCHKLGNWSQWCWSRQSRNPGRPCTRSLKSWSAIPPCKSLTSAILGHRGRRSARKGDNSKIPGKFIFFCSIVFVKLTNHPSCSQLCQLRWTNLSILPKDSVDLCLTWLYFTSVSFLDVWHHLDEVAVVSHHELVMLHHDGKGAVGDNDMCYNSSYLYGLKPLICKLMVE